MCTPPSRTTISHRSSYTAPQHRPERQAVVRVPRASAKDPSTALPRAEFRERATPHICEETWMALNTLAQCTARPLLAHQQKQKQGHQRAGIGSRDSEEEGMGEDWSVYCHLRLACLQVSNALMHACHSCSQGCTVWSLTVLHGRLRTRRSRRHLWSHRIRFSRKNSPSY